MNECAENKKPSLDEIREQIKGKITDRASRIAVLQAEITGMEKTIAELRAEIRAYDNTLALMGCPTVPSHAAMYDRTASTQPRVMDESYDRR